MSKLREVSALVTNGRLKRIEDGVREALEEGDSPEELLSAMIDAMGVVGEMFSRDEIYVPEMLVAATTMKKGVALLRPLLSGDPEHVQGKFIIGTVSGDLHDIGKNLVALMVASAGVEVIDLGVDAPPEKFLEALRNNPDCRVVGISALLTTTMAAMRETVAAIRAADPEKSVKIIVGGAPISSDFAAEIGADAYTADAAAAAKLVKEFVA